MTDMSVPVDRWGRVRGGEREGWFVKLVDDRSGTGGWYVFEAPAPDQRQAFDNWFEARAHAEEYLNEDDIDWSAESTG